MKPAIVALALVTGSLLAVACSEEEPQGFTSDNQSGFLAACTLPLEDSRLTSAICQCVFDESQVEIPFTRFDAIERRLREDPDQELPDELVEIVAQCFIDEAEL